ncbi:hypothetical protein [Brachybacterium sp. GPGPB12]|uniref:hypothetical protein n=1 Tax=Brachybacterium sp. GPGPB12 TaxID=3023517 RepID=UPI003134507A
MANSPDAQGRTVSGEAIYQYIYAIPRGELAKRGIFLQSKRTKRRPRTTGRSWGWSPSRNEARTPRGGGCRDTGSAT